MISEPRPPCPGIRTRKFLSIIYYTLKNNWIFEDFPNFVLAEAKT